MVVAAVVVVEEEVMVEVVGNLSGPSHHSSTGPIYTAVMLLKVPFVLTMTRVMPPEFSSCSFGGSGSGYYILSKCNSNLQVNVNKLIS